MRPAVDLDLRQLLRVEVVGQRRVEHAFEEPRHLPRPVHVVCEKPGPCLLLLPHGPVAVSPAEVRILAGVDQVHAETVGPVPARHGDAPARKMAGHRGVAVALLGRDGEIRDRYANQVQLVRPAVGEHVPPYPRADAVGANEQVELAFRPVRERHMHRPAPPAVPLLREPLDRAAKDVPDAGQVAGQAVQDVAQVAAHDLPLGREGLGAAAGLVAGEVGGGAAAAVDEVDAGLVHDAGAHGGLDAHAPHRLHALPAQVDLLARAAQLRVSLHDGDVARGRRRPHPRQPVGQGRTGDAGAHDEHAQGAWGGVGVSHGGVAGERRSSIGTYSPSGDGVVKSVVVVSTIMDIGDGACVIASEMEGTPAWQAT